MTKKELAALLKKIDTAKGVQAKADKLLTEIRDRLGVAVDGMP